MKIVRVVVFLAVLVGVYLAAPIGVSAACYPDRYAISWSPPWTDSCVVNAAAGSAEGTVYYNCGTYCTGTYDDQSDTCVGGRWQYGCYYHTYWCDSPSCGGGGYG